MTKKELRQSYKARRSAIPSKEKLKMDDLLLIQFQQFDYASIKTVMSYWPMPGQAEPNTHLFTGYLRHMLPGLQITYPVIEMASFKMDAVAIDEETVYHTNAWGITEPKEGIIIDPQKIDLVLVPLLAYDKQGYRVGFGKGFYDRFLARCREDITCIGFSYFGPVERISDTDQFDVPLQYCITPQHIYEF